MNYVYHYALGSTLFLGCTAYFFFRQRRIPTRTNRIYSIMLIAGLIALIFDAMAAAMEVHAMLFPSWLLYLVNILFLLGMHLCLPAFCVYLFEQVDVYSRITRGRRGLLLLPWVCVCLLILSTPLWKGGIFYIDDSHIYRFGATHAVLYVVMGIYWLVLGVFVLRNRRLLNKETFFTVLVLLFLLLASACIQLLFPRYLVTTSATALALSSVYFTMLSPGENIDLATETYNRMALPALLQRAGSGDKHFMLVMFSLKNLSQIEHSFGMEAGEKLLADFGRYLKRLFPKKYVVHTYYTEFAVLDDGGPEALLELNRMVKELPRFWQVGHTTVEIIVHVSALPGQDYPDVTSIINTMDYIIGEGLHTEDGSVLLGDEKLRLACQGDAELTAHAEDLLQNTALRLQCIVDPEGKRSRLEAAPFSSDAAGRRVEPDALIHIMERTGKIAAMYEVFIRQICAYMNQFKPAEKGIIRLIVRMPLCICIEWQTLERISDAILSAGLLPKDFCFAVEESQLLAEEPLARTHMQRMRAQGFLFMLDGFGAGYTNMRLLSQLPVVAVRLDEGLLEQAMWDEKRKMLLAGLKETVELLGLIVVCRGVDTEEKNLLANQLHLPARQGQWFGGYSAAAEMERRLLLNARDGVDGG